MGYLTNFIVYALAMVGVVVVALLVFKSSTNVCKKNDTKFLKVKDSLSLGPRKTLYIVSAGDENFLIAGDVDRTCLISKLEKTKKIESSQEDYESFKETLEKLPSKSSYIDRSVIGIRSTQNKPYDAVMKNLAERIKG